MTRILYTLLVAFTALCVSGETFAQSDTGLSNRKAKLQALSAKLKQRDQADRRQAREYARRLGIPLRRELPNGRVLELQRIAPGIGPVFYITNNVDAADTVSTDEVWPAGSAGLDLDGGGMTIGEWDGGAVFGHEDFTDLTAPPALRVTQVDKDDGPEESGHATHVAGTLVGNGESGLHPVYSPQARGMAYAAHLDAYDWNGDTAEMAAAGATEISPSLDGLLVSNHSYGIAAGWLFMGYDVLPPFRWLWIGGETNFGQDPNFGYYETETAYWDTIAYDAPYYLIVKAAGNDRTDTGPLPLEEYTIIDQNAVILGTSTDTRPADCAPAGYDCLPTTSVAKNILTVGAVDDVIGGYSPFAGPSSVHMAEMSGWGPTDDGRIKPDLVGNGMLLVSTWNDDPYIAAAGTSMAAPNVSGSLLLLQQHYDNIHGSTGNFMRAATLKALAIHTADEAGDADGPDYAFGWGLLNTKAAAQMITDDASIDNEVRNHNRIIEDSLADGTANFIDITTTETDAIITATLVWADPPGTPIAPPLTETDRLLVNDLDLRIKIDPSTEYMPWTLDPAEPAAPATTGDNDRDNVEQVLIDGAGAGTYRFEVSHKGALLDSISQDYSLIISVVPRPQIESILRLDENFAGGLPAGWSVVADTGIDWTINTPVEDDPRLDNLTGGAGEFAVLNNNFRHHTDASLHTPTFNLSSFEAVILRFKSYFMPDESESITVGFSTNGGSSWSDVLTKSDFNIGANNHVLDLSGLAAGQARFVLRFRFASGGAESVKSGNLWQVDDVQLEVFGSALDVSTPAFASVAAVVRQQGSPAGGAVTLGTVNDAETPPGDLAVSPIGGGTANGITVGSVTNTNGTVMATLAAGCSATSGTVRFEVSDDDLLKSTGDLQINVTANSAPVLGYGPRGLTLGGSGTHPVLTGPSDNGSINSISLQDPGTYTGTIAVDPATGLVSISNAQPMGEHTITVRATDNCSSITDATFQLQVAALPGAPSIGAATAGDARATVTFAPPDSDGGSTIVGYTATSNPEGLTGVGTHSPITVQGLTNGLPYTFSVTATNGIGTGPASGVSNEVTPSPAPVTVYFPVKGCRVMDTRYWDSEGTNTEFPIPAQRAVTVHFSNANGDIPLQGGDPGGCPDIPDDAASYVVTVSAFGPGYAIFKGLGYATLVPYDVTRWTEDTEIFVPGASENILYSFDSPPFAAAASLVFDGSTSLITNTTTVKACQGCSWHGLLFASSEANFTVDVVGYFQQKAVDP